MPRFKLSLLTRGMVCESAWTRTKRNWRPRLRARSEAKFPRAFLRAVANRGNRATTAVHGPGENVQINAVVAQIVPLGDELLADVLIESKDRANLRIGSEAEIKIDAYPFSKHGTVRGRVEELASDAVAQESKGSSIRQK